MRSAFKNFIYLIVCFGLVSATSGAETDAHFMKIPNFRIGHEADYKSYYCYFAELDSKNNILPKTSYGPVEIHSPEDGFKYSPTHDLIWAVDRINDVVSVQLRTAKGDILFTASTTDGSAISGLSQNPRTMVLCNHKQQDTMLLPSNKNPFAVINSDHATPPKK